MVSLSPPEYSTTSTPSKLTLPQPHDGNVPVLFRIDNLGKYTQLSVSLETQPQLDCCPAPANILTSTSSFARAEAARIDIGELDPSRSSILIPDLVSKNSLLIPTFISHRHTFKPPSTPPFFFPNIQLNSPSSNFCHPQLFLLLRSHLRSISKHSCSLLILPSDPIMPNAGLG